MVVSASGAVFGGRNKGFTVRSKADGIVVNASATVQGNRVVGNPIAIQVQDGGSGSTIMGNVVSESGVGIEAGGAGVNLVTGTVITSNDFAYNGAVAFGLFGTNCGVAGPDGIVAEKNYWGAATGPGGDPADRACTPPGGGIDTTPFLTRPVSIANQTGR